MLAGKTFRTGVLCSLWLAPGLIFAQQENSQRLPPAATVRAEFQRDIYPILSKNCTACHGASLQKNGLRLDNSAAARSGGYRGPAIKPGDSDGSLVIQMVGGLVPGLIMPPAGRTLSAEQVGLLRAWIDQGAIWPDVPEARGRAERAPTQHRSFVVPKRPQIPQV